MSVKKEKKRSSGQLDRKIAAIKWRESEIERERESWSEAVSSNKLASERPRRSVGEISVGDGQVP